MHTLIRVIVKEILQLRQDRRMIPIIFFAPIVQLVVFGFAVNTDVQDVPMVLVDQDRSPASRELLNDFVQSWYFQLKGTEQDLRAVDRWLLTGDAQMALIVRAGYGDALAMGRTAPVQVIADGSDATSANVALGYASRIVAARGAALMEESRQVAGATVPAGQVELVPRVWYNPELQSRRFYVPAVLAMILMVMTMLLSAMGVVREKEIGTMEQIIVTPIRAWQLLVGKLFPFAVIGSMQVFLVTAVTVWGFGVPLRGSFWLLLVLTQLFILNTLGLGLLVSTLVRTQQQAMMAAAFFVMVPMIYLSGLMFPIENMPTAVQYVTYAIPVRYYANIIRGIFLRGSGLSVLWPEAATLLVMGVSILTLASLRFRKRLD